MTPRPPRIVAELGRPETPAETAERKAEASANHRRRQTAGNLVYSVLATLVAVAIIVFLVPRGDTNYVKPVDYRAVAAQAAGTEPDPIMVPELPSSWTSNSAELRTSGGAPGKIDVWSLGLITPQNTYIGLLQGFGADEGWTAEQLHETAPRGTTTIDGTRWTVYDNRKNGSDVGNAEYALVTELAHSTVVLLGTADDEAFRTVARSLAASLTTNGDAQ